MARPRDFEEDAVLDAAMDSFWQHGFHATSLDALEADTGLNRSSLYNTFGSKTDLFCGALDRYSAGPCTVLFRPLNEDRGATALGGYLDGLAAFVGSPDVRRGCLMVKTSVDGGAGTAVRRRVNAHFRQLRSGYERVFAEGLKDGSIQIALTPAEAADWLLAFVRGVLTGAAGGESVAALRRAIRAAKKQLGVAS